jgi:hypothetical protein
MTSRRSLDVLGLTLLLGCGGDISRSDNAPDADVTISGATGSSTSGSSSTSSATGSSTSGSSSASSGTGSGAGGQGGTAVQNLCTVPEPPDCTCTMENLGYHDVCKFVIRACDAGSCPCAQPPPGLDCAGWTGPCVFGAFVCSCNATRIVCSERQGTVDADVDHEDARPASFDAHTDVADGAALSE